MGRIIDEKASVEPGVKSRLNRGFLKDVLRHAAERAIAQFVHGGEQVLRDAYLGFEQLLSAGASPKP